MVIHNSEIDSQLLNEIVEMNRDYCHQGSIPTYIPALLNAKKDHLGIYVTECNGNSSYYGDYQQPFSIQSISKVITLTMALIDNGLENVFSRVGVEPTEDKFNSILPLELSSAYPSNPMINAGAIVTTSMIHGRTYEEKFNRILNFTKRLAGNSNIYVDEDVFVSERRTGDKNRSLAYYLKDADVLIGEVDSVLDVYFRHCSIAVTAADLSKIGYILANNGRTAAGEELIPVNICKIVRTVMAMSGLYDESGTFAVKVGIPAKSGVGGGILGVVPGKMGIGFYGPSLNSKGTSVVGFKVLEDLIYRINGSIY